MNIVSGGLGEQEWNVGRRRASLYGTWSAKRGKPLFRRPARSSGIPVLFGRPKRVSHARVPQWVGLLNGLEAHIVTSNMETKKNVYLKLRCLNFIFEIEMPNLIVDNILSLGVSLTLI